MLHYKFLSYHKQKCIKLNNTEFLAWWVIQDLRWHCYTHFLHAIKLQSKTVKLFHICSYLPTTHNYSSWQGAYAYSIIATHYHFSLEVCNPLPPVSLTLTSYQYTMHHILGTSKEIIIVTKCMYVDYLTNVYAAKQI